MLIVAGLVVAFVLIVLFANRETRACRWREDRSASRPGQTKYRCAACGAQTVTEGPPPKLCHAGRGR